MAIIVTMDNHQNGTIPSERRIDLDYFKSPPGLIKIAQFVLGAIFIGFCPYWISWIAWIIITLTFSWMWIYLFALQSKYQSPRVPWPVLEFYFTAGATVLYVLLTLITFFTFFHMVAAIFGLLATITYAVGAFLLLPGWREWKSQNAAMGGMQGP